MIMIQFAIEMTAYQVKHKSEKLSNFKSLQEREGNRRKGEKEKKYNEDAQFNSY